MPKRLTKCAAKIVVIGAAVWTIPAIDPTYAQMNAADVARSRGLADRLCAGCHITSSTSGATPTNADVPSFAAIAKRADMSAERLAGRIIIPHPAMPNTQLTVAELRDIIAYIQTMKPAR
jgi:cytochrome c